jgi:hypothetical protein
MKDFLKPAKPGDPPLSTEQQEFFKFIADQWQANRDSLRDETKEIRSFFETLTKWFFGAVSAIVLVAGGLATFLGVREYGSFQKQVETDLRQEVKDNFANDQKIAAVVNQAAKDATKAEAHDLISDSVHREVESEVKQIAPQIKNAADVTINEKVRPALAKLDATIDSEKVVTEHIAEMNSWGQLQQRAINNDDASAFDSLLQVYLAAGTNKPVIEAYLNGIEIAYRNPNVPVHYLISPNCAEIPKLESIEQDLLNKGADTNVRLKAADILPSFTYASGMKCFDSGTGKSLEAAVEAAPVLLKAMKQDGSLSVRYVALRAFNRIFRGGLDYPNEGVRLVALDGEQVSPQVWLESHKDVLEEEVASARLPGSNGASGSFDEWWDELSVLETKGGETKRRIVESVRTRVKDTLDKSWASNKDSGAALSDETMRQQLAKLKDGLRPGATPAEIAKFIQNEWFERTEFSAMVKYALLERMEKDETVSGALVELTSGSQYVFNRYYAMQVINKWYGQSFGLDDLKSIRSWWNSRQAKP